MYKSILVPVDGRERGTRSIALACGMAADFDSHLVGPYVQSPPNVPAAARAAGTGRMLEELQKRVVAELAAAARASRPMSMLRARLAPSGAPPKASEPR